MKVYRHIEEFKPLSFGVATTGTFDGVHQGHRFILDRLARIRDEHKGAESVLLTFDPHPREVLQPGTHLKLLNSMDEKIQRLEAAGLDHLVIHPFDRSFSRTSSLEFVRNILVQKLGVRKLVIGYDHHFGRNREGSFAHLKEYGPLYGFDVEEIPAQDIDQVAVSSTKIRSALKDGDMQRANLFLGYTYGADTEVVHGDRMGRTIGFPTANCRFIETRKVIPGDGVYAVQVGHGDRVIGGMCHIGRRPTVDDAAESRVEVHLLDFKEDLYGEALRLSFVRRVRDVLRFESMQQLKEQLERDEKVVREVLGQSGSEV